MLNRRRCRHTRLGHGHAVLPIRKDGDSFRIWTAAIRLDNAVPRIDKLRDISLRYGIASEVIDRKKTFHRKLRDLVDCEAWPASRKIEICGDFGFKLGVGAWGLDNAVEAQFQGVFICSVANLVVDSVDLRFQPAAVSSDNGNDRSQSIEIRRPRARNVHRPANQDIFAGIYEQRSRVAVSLVKWSTESQVFILRDELRKSLLLEPV